jgi:hypothetical protein
VIINLLTTDGAVPPGAAPRRCARPQSDERCEGLRGARPSGAPPHISAYYAAAAGSGVGLDQGTADWSAVRLRPRVLDHCAVLSCTVRWFKLTRGAANYCEVVCSWEDPRSAVRTVV